MIFQFLRVIGFPMGESPWRIVNPLTPKGDSFVSQLGSFARSRASTRKSCCGTLLFYGFVLAPKRASKLSILPRLLTRKDILMKHKRYILGCVYWESAVFRGFPFFILKPSPHKLPMLGTRMIGRGCHWPCPNGRDMDTALQEKRVELGLP